MSININEAIRYLGYGTTPPSQRILEELDWAISEIESCAVPKNTFIELDCSITDKNVTMGSLKVESAGLSKNLAGCEKVILFAQTLGVMPDMLIKRYARMDMSKMVILQAVAAAMVEDCCNLFQETLRADMLNEGCYLRPRFSPGYGDFSLQHQPEILRILDTPRKIGLTITDGMMLAPSKSVTAVIGVSKYNLPCPDNGCEACTKIDCIYKR